MNNKLILGTVQFGLNYGINNKEGKLPKLEIFKILEKAYDLGIRTLDTAEAYGTAHDIINEFHKLVPFRFKIISKFSGDIKKYPNDILERLKIHVHYFDVSKLEAYFFHSFKDFKSSLKRDNLVLQKIKDSNLTNKIGVSVYTNEQIEEVINHKEINLIQLPFNLFDNESKRGEVISKAKERGVEIHTRSVFLQGLFLKDNGSLKGNLVELKNDLNDLNELLITYRIETVIAALNYVCSKSYIDKVLIGVDNIDQLKMNLDSLEYDLPQKLIKKIDQINVKNKELLNPSQWRE